MDSEYALPPEIKENNYPEFLTGSIEKGCILWHNSCANNVLSQRRAPAFADKNARTTLSFGPFTPVETGVITWTATITDADPDVDTRVKTTKVK